MKNTVTWILTDDAGGIVAQTELSILDEEKAIDMMCLNMHSRDIRGRYKLGYIDANGVRRMRMGYQIFKKNAPLGYSVRLRGFRLSCENEAFTYCMPQTFLRT